MTDALRTLGTFRYFGPLRLGLAREVISRLRAGAEGFSSTENLGVDQDPTAVIHIPLLPGDIRV